MPPQAPQNIPPSQPTTPASQFDFATGNPQQSQKPKFGIPGFKSGKKLPIIILAALIGLIFLIIILSSVFGGKGTKAEDLIKIAARAEEISRISAVVIQESKDSDLIALASTTQTTLKSDKAELIGLITSSGKKVKGNSLEIYVDSKTDEELKSALQTNTLDTFYFSYLEEQLNKYRQTLVYYAPTSSDNVKQILGDAYDSAGIILSSEQVKSISGN
jgi:hypothetical protein